MAMSSPVVLITGALTGIGRAAARTFAQAGAHLVVSGRRDKEGQELVAELQGLGAESIFVHTDVRNENEVRDLVDQAVARFGRLDVAVNARGLRVSPARSRNRRLKPTLRLSIQTSWVRCSA